MCECSDDGTREEAGQTILWYLRPALIAEITTYAIQFPLRGLALLGNWL
jgi:hypothetical protein